MRYVSFTNDGFWSEWDETEVLDKWDSNVFYVYATDCGDWHKVRKAPRIWFELEIMNGESHFSHEDSSIWTFNLVMLAFFTIMLGYSVLRYLQEARREDTWLSPLGILSLAIMMEFFAIFMKLVNLTFYMYDGEGTLIFRALANINQTLSQMLVISLLLLIAYGWTITHENFTDFEILGVVACIVSTFQILLATITIVDKDELHKYHDYGGYQGFALVMARIGLYIGFVAGVIPLHSKCQKRS